MELKDLVVGKQYIEFAVNPIDLIYCGLNDLGIPTFELMYEPCGIAAECKPKQYVPIGTNTYWSYHGLENNVKINIMAERDDKLIQLGL